MHRIPAGVSVVRTPTGARCVDAAAAAVQVGLTAGPREGLVVADAALRAGLALPADLVQAVQAYRRTPGISAVRTALGYADGAAESPGESRLRHVVVLLGHRVELQFEVAVGSVRYRADLRVTGTRLLLEYDGADKYRDPQERHRERDREADVRGRGWEVARFGNRDLRRPARVQELLDLGLRRAAALERVWDLSTSPS